MPWCLPGLLTSGFLWSRRRGKDSLHSRRMHNPQFCVSGTTPFGNRVIRGCSEEDVGHLGCLRCRKLRWRRRISGVNLKLERSCPASFKRTMSIFQHVTYVESFCSVSVGREQIFDYWITYAPTPRMYTASRNGNRPYDKYVYLIRAVHIA